MEESGQTLHDEKNCHCQNGEEEKDYGEDDEASEAFASETYVHHHGPQHLR